MTVKEIILKDPGVKSYLLIVTVLKSLESMCAEKSLLDERSALRCPLCIIPGERLRLRSIPLDCHSTSATKSLI